MSKPVRALLFDFDGTLAHYTGDFAALLQAVTDHLSLSATESRKAIERFGQRVRCKGPSTLPLILSGVLRDLGQPEQDVLATADLMMEHYLSGMALLPGAKEVLELTCHLPRAVITNGPSDMQRAAIRKVGIEKAFQTIIVSGDEDVAVRKPDARIFEIACGRLGTAPETTLMIGDNLEADVKGALAYGMPAVWISHPNRFENKPVEDVESVRDTAALRGYLEAKLASR